ncbi:MAG TPA: hypothetical protein VMU81_28210 [Acetobacteraceae bacterium]|jgi:2C-methyl-D-erythritol 2,4-cyclodiphosphate synthase|nr:hypothetical protein [Acetobacteraceae bacterium]
MTQVNPNDAASSGSQEIQGAIAKLDALKKIPGANFAAIDEKINDLQAQDAALTNLALQTMVDAPKFGQEVAAMSAAAAALKAEAANMQIAAKDVTAVAKVVSAAASLVTALQPFV